MKVRYVIIYECLFCKYDDDICFIFSVLFLLNEIYYLLLILWVNIILCYFMSMFFLFFRYIDNLIDVLLSREGELFYIYFK